MGFFSRFERKMEDGLEGAADKIFDAPISPVQISKRAEKAMRREKMVGAGREYAPTLYTVLVNPEDDQRLFGYYPTLAGETETYLAARATEHGLLMDGQPLVRFIVDNDLKHGKFDIIAEMVSAPIVEQLRAEEMRRYGIGGRNSGRFAPAPAPQPRPRPVADAQWDARPEEAYRQAQDAASAAGGQWEAQPAAGYRRAQDAPSGPQGPWGAPLAAPGAGEDYETYGGVAFGTRSSGPRPTQGAPAPARESAAYGEAAAPTFAPASAPAQDQAAYRAAGPASEAASAPAAVSGAYRTAGSAQGQAAYGEAAAPVFAPAPAANRVAASASEAAPAPAPVEVPPLDAPPKKVKRELPYVPEEEIDRSLDYGEYTFNSQDFQEGRYDYDAASEPRRETHDFTQGNARYAAADQRRSVLVGLEDNSRYKLEKGIVTIGRGTENDIVVNDINASRRHAELRREDDGTWTIIDLNSTNGTLVNGRRMGSANLRNGDRITVGVVDYLLMGE